MPGPVPPLLLAIGAAMLLLVGGVALLLRRIGQQERIAGRTLAVAGPYRPAAPPGQGKLRRLAEALPSGAIVEKLTWVFGFSLAKRAEIGLPWWLVLLVTLALAWPLAILVAGVLGDYAMPALPLLWLGLSRAVFGYLRSRHLEKLYRQMPDALGIIIRAVRVGIPVSEAIRTVANEAQQPTAREFAKLADALTIGISLEDALRDMAYRSGLPEYRFFATALILQAQTGGGLSETLDNLADVIRRRIGLRLRAVALASEARTSAAILTGLPIVTALVLMVVNPDYIDTLFQPEGRTILAAAVLMLLGGTAAMRTIISRSLDT